MPFLPPNQQRQSTGCTLRRINVTELEKYSECVHSDVSIDIARAVVLELRQRFSTFVTLWTLQKFQADHRLKTPELRDLVRSVCS